MLPGSVDQVTSVGEHEQISIPQLHVGLLPHKFIRRKIRNIPVNSKKFSSVGFVVSADLASEEFSVFHTDYGGLRATVSSH